MTQRAFPESGRTFSFLAAAFFLALLPGCDSDAPRQPAAATATPLDRSAPGAATPLVPTAVPAPVAPQPSVAEFYPATAPRIATARSAAGGSTAVSPNGDINLNFVNADIRDVVKSVLGDFLKLNYVIDAAIQGAITLQTNQPIARASVLAVLEQTLSLNGVALVRSGDLYKVIPSGNAATQNGSPATDAFHDSGAGFGTTVVPLRYVAAADMQRLLQPLLPASAVLSIDSARNLLLVTASAPARSMLRQDIALFDADWLSGMSFALYTPQYVDAGELMKELQQVIGRDSPIASLVRFVPIDRLNGLLAVSPQARYLSDLAVWVRRLDRPGNPDERRIYVYHVQNGRAKDMASVLTAVLSGGHGGAAQYAAAAPDTTDAASNDTDALAPPGAGYGRAAPSRSASLPLSAPAAPGGADTGIGVGAIGDFNITADETNNALLVLAVPSEYRVIEAALRQLDTVPLQVMIDAAVAEVTLTKDLQFGLQYFFQSGNHQLVLSGGSNAAVTATYPGFSYLFSPGTNIQVILNALDNVSHVNVLSSPKVFVLNNQTATLQVGDQVPVATAQSQSTSTTGAPVINNIEFKDTGVILKVTPRVNDGGMVMMDIDQEVSDVAPTTSSKIDSPTIQQRKISSSVAVQDGETLALGGLIKDNHTNTRTGVPYLQDIPYLGAVFRSTEKKDTRTELLVLITPHVVENLQGARQVTEELRRKLPQAHALLDTAR